MPGPLAGLRVLDLSRVLAGPYAAMLLGDMGADVIKIEQPGEGDETRAWGPPFAGGESAYYLSVNRNKRGITLNLKADGGRRVFLDLVAKSDILIDNFRHGTLERMGLDDATLWQTNPGLIHAAISGFGTSGPYRDYAGYDFVVQAMSGIMSVTGEADGEPTKVGVAIVDVTAGLFTMSGILAALHARTASGRGQRIDVSLLESAMAWLVNVGSNYLIGGQTPRRYGNAHPNIVPYQAFRAKDRPLALAIANQRQFRRFCELAGEPGLADDPRFLTNADRLANRPALIDALQRIVEQRPAAEWLTLLNEQGIPAGPINSVADAFADPQVQALGLVHSLAHSSAGEVPVVGPPFHFSETPAEPRSAPPLLGQHTDGVLAELLGLDAAAIEDLRNQGAV